eukprot:scaffold1878_cov113-Isochrysis_galbana.AAC.3
MSLVTCVRLALRYAPVSRRNTRGDTDRERWVDRGAEDGRRRGAEGLVRCAKRGRDCSTVATAGWRLLNRRCPGPSVGGASGRRRASLWGAPPRHGPSPLRPPLAAACPPARRRPLSACGARPCPPASASIAVGSPPPPPPPETRSRRAGGRKLPQAALAAPRRACPAGRRCVRAGRAALRSAAPRPAPSGGALSRRPARRGECGHTW